jgi:hypothetical protein
VKWLVLFLVAACDNNFAERWQLNNDRIIAVRMTPSTLGVGETGVVDAYVTSTTTGPTVISPTSMDSTTLQISGDQITAPDSATLAMYRTQAGLAVDADVGLEISAVFTINGAPYVATKTVYCGAHGDNPTLGAITLDGVAPTDPITVPFDVDVQLAIDEDSTVLVNWFTSVGKLDDDDNEHMAKLHVKAGDPMTGQFAVVIRDVVGGVAFQDWSMQTAAPTE